MASFTNSLGLRGERWLSHKCGRLKSSTCTKAERYYEVFLNDLEHPWVGTVNKDLAVKAGQWIEGGEVGITVKPGKADIWELVDVPEISLEKEFAEKDKWKTRTEDDGSEGRGVIE
jgi:hypothetical protein